MNLPMDMDNEDGDDLDNEDVDSDMVELTHEDNLEAATKDGELSVNKMPGLPIWSIYSTPPNMIIGD